MSAARPREALEDRLQLTDIASSGLIRSRTAAPYLPGSAASPDR
jgi:hypothetical protein